VLTLFLSGATFLIEDLGQNALTHKQPTTQTRHENAPYTPNPRAKHKVPRELTPVGAA
jgi:hypothetical protein